MKKKVRTKNQIESQARYDQKMKDAGLVQMPRCWIPEKDVEFFRGLAQIVKNDYLRGK